MPGSLNDLQTIDLPCAALSGRAEFAVQEALSSDSRSSLQRMTMRGGWRSVVTAPNSP